MTAGKFAVFVRDFLAQHNFGKLAVRFEQQKIIFRAAVEIEKRQTGGSVGGQIRKQFHQVIGFERRRISAVAESCEQRIFNVRRIKREFTGFAPRSGDDRPAPRISEREFFGVLNPNFNAP